MLKHLIEQWIGEEKETYHPNNQHQEDVSIAYNQALTDLKSRIPELEGMIVGEIEKTKCGECGYLSVNPFGECHCSYEGIRFVKKDDIITSLKGDKE